MDQKKVIEMLVKIANRQQKIIDKLAQQLPGGGDVIMGPAGGASVPSHQPPPTAMQPQHPELHPEAAIRGALPPQVNQAIQMLSVKPMDDPRYDHKVSYTFHPGKGSGTAIQAIKNVVNKLQRDGTLQSLKGKSYLVEEKPV